MPSPRVIADMLGLPFWLEGDRLYRFDNGRRGIRDAGWTPAPDACASYRRASAEEQALWAALWDDSVGVALWARAAVAQWPQQMGRALSEPERAFCRDQAWLLGWETNGWAHIVLGAEDGADAMLCMRQAAAARKHTVIVRTWFTDRHWGLPRGDGRVVDADCHVTCESCLRALELRMQPVAAQPEASP
jgi:hypothetical protein